MADGEGLRKCGATSFEGPLGLMYIEVVVLMRLGAFVGFVRRSDFMCGKNF